MNPERLVQHEVLLVQERFWQALRTKDASELSAIIAPTFIGRSPGESDQTREEFITTLTTFPFAISEIAGEAIEIHVFDNIAILTGIQVARLQVSEGKAKNSRVMLTNVYLQEDRIWQLVLCHAFEIVQDI